MDKSLLVAIVMSLGAHGIVMVKLPSIGTSDLLQSVDLEIEISYIAENAVRSDTLAVTDLNTYSEPRQEVVSIGSEVEKQPPELIRGTSEIIRGEVREVLKPLECAHGKTASDLEAIMREYKIRLEAILEQESGLSYPHGARESKREARYTIRFQVRSDGSLRKIEIPPGSDDFGSEIETGLKRAAAYFPVFPKEITARELTFCWPVSFNLF